MKSARNAIDPATTHENYNLMIEGGQNKEWESNRIESNQYEIATTSITNTANIND